jgi:hypothetical protein
MWNGSLAFVATAAATFAAVPTGTGRLGDDDQFAGHVLADLVGHAKDVTQVGGSVLVRRRAHGDEHHVGPRDRARNVGGELQAALLLVPLDHGVQPGLVNRDDVLLEPFDLLGVGVRACHVVAGFGETRTDHETDIAGTDDGNVHGISG